MKLALLLALVLTLPGCATPVPVVTQAAPPPLSCSAGVCEVKDGIVLELGKARLPYIWCEPTLEHPDEC